MEGSRPMKRKRNLHLHRMIKHHRKLNKPQFSHFSKSFFKRQPHIFGRAFKWDEIYFRCFSNDNVRTLTSNTRNVAIGMP